MTISNFKAVYEFHVQLNEQLPTKPQLPPEATLALRRRLLQEEFQELIQALEQGNLSAIAQEAIDLLYVTYGLCVVCGIDADQVFDLIHQANMTKLKGPRRADGKQLKPEGWMAPDVGALLDQLSE